MASQPKGIKEFLRKRVVALKRKPQTIALIAFANKKEPETVEQHVSDSMDIFKEKISSSM